LFYSDVLCPVDDGSLITVGQSHLVLLQSYAPCNVMKVCTVLSCGCAQLRHAAQVCIILCRRRFSHWNARPVGEVCRNANITFLREFRVPLRFYQHLSVIDSDFQMFDSLGADFPCHLVMRLHWLRPRFTNAHCCSVATYHLCWSNWSKDAFEGFPLARLFLSLELSLSGTAALCALLPMRSYDTFSSICKPHALPLTCTLSLQRYIYISALQPFLFNLPLQEFYLKISPHLLFSVS